MKTEWQRPKSTRLYLHAPKSERMFTLWREGKVMFGEIEEKIREYETFTSAGIWFVDGDGGQFDFKENEYAISHDGIPPHALKHTLGALELTLEGFGTPERKSVCHVKLTLENKGEKTATESFGFMLRTGKEEELIFHAPDVYRFYTPDISVWYGMPATWTETEWGYTDGERNLSVKSELPLTFDAESGIVSVKATLAAGESATVCFAYDIGKVAEANYDTECARTLAFWESELSRINKLPKSFTAEQVRHVKNLTVQLLQCFCYPRGEKFLLSRQGGLQRQIWTYESMSVIEALFRIGDFEDYIEPVIDSYFNEYYTDSGEVVPLGISWAMITGNVLQTFGKYSIHRGKEFFLRYNYKAYHAFEWIKETRASVRDTENLASGVFPPKSSCDDQLVFQAWCNTDTFNLRGLSALAEAFELYGDPRAAEVRAEYDAYLARMRQLWREIADKNTTDELEVPFSPRVKNELIAEKFVFSPLSAYMVEGLDMPLSDADRILRHYTRTGMIRGGLYDRMPDKNHGASTTCNLDENGRCSVYYVCCHEYYWFLYFMRHGMRDKCEEILRDNEKYATTSEYYMIERYHKDNPWFAPWSPNASANGRTINMMLDFYG